MNVDEMWLHLGAFGKTWPLESHLIRFWRLPWWMWGPQTVCHHGRQPRGLAHESTFPRNRILRLICIPLYTLAFPLPRPLLVPCWWVVCQDTLLQVPLNLPVPLPWCIVEILVKDAGSLKTLWGLIIHSEETLLCLFSYSLVHPIVGFSKSE